MAEAVSCRVSIAKEMTATSHGCLFLLYRPLMGSAAATLFEILLAVARQQPQLSLQELLQLSGFTAAQFEAARRRLEQFLLLSTYSNEEQTLFVFSLYAPLEAHAFLRHEVFGRLTMEKFSAEHFEKLKTMYDTAPMQGDLKNISAAMDPEILDGSWDESKELLLQKHLPAAVDSVRYPFDWNQFFMGQDRAFPERIRTPEIKNQIAFLAHVYGLDEKGIRIYAVQAMNSSKTAIDFDLLKTKLQHTTKIKPEARSDKYQLAPIQFLMKTQPKGTQILPSERQLLEELSGSYGFADEVINQLLEYSLKKCQNALQENYIRKVANTWKRNGIESRAQALAFIQQENQTRAWNPSSRVEDHLPDWYKNTETKPASQELIEKALEMQRALKEK